MLGRQRLRRRPVARVPGPAGRRLVVLIAQVLGQLGIHRALDQPARQIGQQAARPDDLLLAARAGEQLVDQLIAEPLTNLRGSSLDRRARGARAAGISLRSPSGLAPRDAGAGPSFPLDRSWCFVDMRLLFAHAYTEDRTLPANPNNSAHNTLYDEGVLPGRRLRRGQARTGEIANRTTGGWAIRYHDGRTCAVSAAGFGRRRRRRRCSRRAAPGAPRPVVPARATVRELVDAFLEQYRARRRAEWLRYHLGKATAAR